MPDLISFRSKLSRIRDILSHQVGPDVQREMIEKETFEKETFILVHSVVQRERGAHLPHQGGGFLVGGQVELHESSIPLRVWSSVRYSLRDS